MKKPRKASKTVRIDSAKLLGFRLVQGDEAVDGMDATPSARIGGKVGKPKIRRKSPKEVR